jgi:hypothetical protein
MIETETRNTTLVASGSVELEGGLTLPPGRYRAIKKRIRIVTAGGKTTHSPPEYLLDLSACQLIETVDKPAVVEVTEHVRLGALRDIDR